MTRYLLRRLAGMVVVMFLVATIVFVIAHVIPGDPAAVMLGPSATAADIAALRSTARPRCVAACAVCAVPGLGGRTCGWVSRSSWAAA